MLYRWLLILKKPGNRLWVTPSLGALLAICFAFTAKLVNLWLPPDSLPDIHLGTLESLLDVIASSMLAVSTFSLSIMVSAFASAAGGATPRATELVMGDDTTRTAIASFISAFIYAIIAKTALGMGFYTQNGRFILFISTALVLVYLIITLIRWVHTLSQLGRMGNTLSKIYTATRISLLDYRRNPDMGACWQRQGELPIELRAEEGGYLTHIDMAGLQKRAESADLHLHIAVRPGQLLIPGSLIAALSRPPEDEQALRSCFVLDVSRNYAQDPGWGLIVLSEAAQRALSPAVNDPGTAIDVMARLMRLLVEARPSADENHTVPQYDRLSLAPADGKRWINDAFAPIARDGAAIVEVGDMLQSVLAAIWRGVPENDIAEAARDMAQQALARAQNSPCFADDLARIEARHHALFAATATPAAQPSAIAP